MFERYTEKTRRVIFFSRFEVSTLGGHEIDTEHLLLGLLQEDAGLLQQLVKPPFDAETIRLQIREAAQRGGERTSTSVDLPLSEDSKRALAFAADEAERLRHRHISSEHLLLGILRQEGCRAAQVLRQNGLTLDAAREVCSKMPLDISVGKEQITYLSSFPREALQQALQRLGQEPRQPTPVAASISSEKAVEIESLTKRFEGVSGPLDILQGIDLTIYKGEIIAIVGQSGSGKSTLLHILGTIDRPTSGTVRFGDQNPFELSAEELAKFRRRSIGFVFQFHNLLPEFTALENVLMPRLIAGHRSDERMGVELLELVGLGNRLKHRPGELSGGEQQRVAIARALVNNPLLILADEPTGALDNQTGELVFQLFQKIQREKNLTSILATHNASIANRCNRLFRLENSRLHEISQHYV
jgi:lipoprotein-releasing system ATP-binding protein